MQPQRAFVDIHCHLLPGIDDGSGSLGETLAMAKMAVADGIGRIVATPHQLGSYDENRGAKIRSLTRQIQQLLDENQIDLQVLPGADVRIEEDLVTKIRNEDVLTLADHHKHVLLELPHELYFPIGSLLDTLGKAGMVGILSHPERNQGLLDQPHLVSQLVGQGCLMQITAGSLLGRFGKQSARMSERLLRQGLVHFVATDAHGVTSRRPQLRPAFERVTELVGETIANQLFCHNPAAVASGKEVEVTVPTLPKRGLSRWFRWFQSA